MRVGRIEGSQPASGARCATPWSATFGSDLRRSARAASSACAVCSNRNTVCASTISGCSMTLPRVRSKSSPSSPKPRRRGGSTKRAHPTTVALAKVKDDLSKYLRLAATEEIIVTRHGRPAGVLIGFDSEEDWFDYRLEHHPEFLRRIASALAPPPPAPARGPRGGEGQAPQ